MITIRKYSLMSGGIPIGSRVLHCGLQDGEPMAWAEVNPTETRMQPVFPVPTGADFPVEDGWQYIGTVVGVKGFLVFHYYMLIAK